MGRCTASASGKYDEEKEAELELTGMEREEERPPGEPNKHTHTHFSDNTPIFFSFILTSITVVVLYPAVMVCVSQCKAFDPQDKDAVVELDKVATFLLL